MNTVSTAVDKASDSSLSFIQGLCRAEAFDHDIDAIRIVETHISWVILTGRYAYKIKKPVNFGFLDFSTLEKRRFFCTEELRLNRRLAADIYLEVVPITGTPSDPRIGGSGDIIEYAVKMNQFAEGQLLTDRQEYGELSTDEIDQIARTVADFHAIVDKTNVDSPYGGAQDIKHWFDENFVQIAPLLKEDRHKQQLRDIQRWGDAEWSDKSAFMQRRKEQGFVKECHGDLHLSNITLIDDRVLLFDCIEFNPQLRWIDVVSEIAFLVIDLLYFGYEGHAFRFLNRYLQYTGDYAGLALLRYYLVYRALVLAKVSLLRMQQCQGSDYQQAYEKFSVFLNLAERFIRKNSVYLIITHGFSGSGKSTYAELCAETIGAIVIRSDVERKRLFGFRAQEATGSDVNSGIYTEAAGVNTYQLLADLVKPGLSAGVSVIVDATFLKSWQRDMFRHVAAETAVQFIILDIQASDQELDRRIRQRNNDASEATIDVLLLQQRTAQPLSSEELPHAVSIDSESSDAVDILLQRFNLNGR
jgi:aminoglycoside phosphotransferase family enzyme/gluconate kinase